VVTAFRRLMPHMAAISGALLIVAGLFVGYYAWVELRELDSGASSPVVDWTRDVQSWLQNHVERIGGARLAVAAALVIGAVVAVALITRRGAERRSVDARDHLGQPDRGRETDRS
ncbi:MAG TPA: hypothetical protein PLY51_14925, partial [Microthrixaceae bacterium]|nr:hypothetical protein [Microthrixaceae bacterium]